MPDAFEQMEQRMRAGTNPITGRPPSTEDYVKFYGMSSDHPSGQFFNILGDRRLLDRLAAETRTPRDLNLRNAEHYFVTNHMMHGGDPSPEVANIPALGAPLAALQVPGYSALKWLGQKTGLGFRDSTPPSWEEMRWGLAPYWGGIPQSAAQPPQQLSLPALMALMRAASGTLQ